MPLQRYVRFPAFRASEFLTRGAIERDYIQKATDRRIVNELPESRL